LLMNFPLDWVLPSRRAFALMILGLGIFLFRPMTSSAKIFYAKDEALKLAFPGADSVESRTFILKDSELERAQRLAHTRIESKLFTFYIGRNNGEILGYAAIESHIVRTLPETIMVVLSPEGQVRSTVVLAFHEPPDYLPSKRWLSQFHRKGLSPELRPGRKIAGIVGSTLTVQAISGGVRKVLALFAILIKEKR